MINFNHILMMRELGAVLPLSAMNKVNLSTGKINAIKMDNGENDIRKDDNGNIVTTPITYNTSSLPEVPPTEDWGMQTELYANFNSGTLDAGVVSVFGAEIAHILVRRASSRTEFKIWEDIHVVQDVQNQVTADLSYRWVDKDIESGVIYAYALQPIDSNGVRGALYRMGSRAQVYDSIFLVGDGGKQLKLKFDAQVSSVKRNIREARKETIGGKYPHIARNADVNYKEMSISGLITHFMDEKKDFAPRAELFLSDNFSPTMDLVDDYQEVYNAYELNDFNNTVLEREFRTKVEAFLNDGKPKLFKSPTEGNMIVRLMDVSFTPNNQLGRLIYSFSCTAVEVDEYNLDNLDKYNIQAR